MVSVQRLTDLYDAYVDTFRGADGELPPMMRLKREHTAHVVENARAIAAGHTFFIALRKAYPINVLDRVKNCQEVCRVFAATANPLQIVTAETEQGRGIVGVIDGFPPKGVETEADIKGRRALLSDIIGYKR